jgi:hypothetical protein
MCDIKIDVKETQLKGVDRADWTKLTEERLQQWTRQYKVGFHRRLGISWEATNNFSEGVSMEFAKIPILEAWK